VRSVSTELADALTTSERVLRVTVHIDWDNDGYNGDGTIDDLTNAVSQVAIGQTLSTNVPSATQPVVGAAVAQLGVDIDQGHVFGARRLPVVRGITSATAATGTGLISVTAPASQPGDEVFAWIASPSDRQYVIRENGTNVSWNQITVRGDYNKAFTRVITARILTRRVPTDGSTEPATYTFKVSDTQAWVATVVVVSGGTTPGIHAYSAKGADAGGLDSTYTQLDGVPIYTTLDDCLVLAFVAGWAAAGGGVTWTPVAPFTELVDVCSTSGIENATIAVMQNSNVAHGTVVASAVISAATEPGVVFTVALAPMQDGSDAQNAAWTYSELNPTTVYAGKQRDGRAITVALDIATRNGVQSVPLFTGRSLGIDVSSRSRRAKLTALDNRELMRAQAVDDFIPPAVIAESPELWSGETLPYFPGLEATWLVSYVFAWCRLDYSSVTFNQGPVAGSGFFASPNVRPSTILHVPCHGALVPFVGFTMYAYTQDAAGRQTRVTFDRGPYVGATFPAPVGGKVDGKFGIVGSSLPWSRTTGACAGRIEYAVRLNTSGAGATTLGITGDTPLTRFAYLNVDPTRTLTLQLAIEAGITRTVTGPMLPDDHLWHNVGCHWDSRTGVATFRVDGVNTVVGFATFTGTPPASQQALGFMTVTDSVQVAEFQVCGGFPASVGFKDADVIAATDPFAWENFVPSAFIDRSVNVMDGTPAVDAGSDVWQLLTQLAEAEFAAVYFDADGFPHYRTRYSDVTDTGQTVVRQLTTLNALRDVDYQSGVDQLANQIQVATTPLAVTLDGVAWRPSQSLRVPASSSITLLATLDGVVLPTTVENFTVGPANTRPDGSGTVVSNVTVGGSVSGSRITVGVTNTNTFDVYLVDSTGQPNAQLTASWMSAGSVIAGAITRDTESIRRHGVQPLPGGTSTNRWRQRTDTSSAIAQILLSDLAEPKPVLTNVKIVGDPRLQFGDLVTLVDSDGLNPGGQYRLVGISPEYSRTNGFTQSLVLRSAGCAVAVWDQSYWDDCTVWGA
jgi:hypothetical protein